MAQREIVFVNGSNVRLKFSYRYGLTASKIQYLQTLAPNESFTYKVRDDGTYEKIEVDYQISSEGSGYFKPTNLKINADTMSKYSKITVADCGHSGDVGTARMFRLETEDRPPTPGASEIVSGIARGIADSVGSVGARLFGNGASAGQDIPR
ncbi:hypothetical protein KC19_9G170200 [Ceratodon purpureus]|uniref:Uncharacterized protein n=1 Tax=Ceratodon purpureus TaxID=3225 RepID=A0A8T0H0X7_CERPU|nr:hypothetical protein KC19_9G170200 [Ceratodon purpureus]KAG0562771.1 hypothetical protein KC19_9G170200 [Ceratodon purpureus]KAG0562772.1 hypothetical protein KC19_9G170200 [Ceratodon purpureus]